MAAPFGFQLAHDPVGSGESVGAATGKHQRLNRLDLHTRSKQADLAGPGSGSTDFDRSYVRLGECHHRHAGHRFNIGPVANRYSIDGSHGGIRSH